MDIDVGHGTGTVHDAKGGKHREALIAGVSETHRPESTDRTYPNAPRPTYLHLLDRPGAGAPARSTFNPSRQDATPHFLLGCPDLLR